MPAVMLPLALCLEGKAEKDDQEEKDEREEKYDQHEKKEAEQEGKQAEGKALYAKA